MGAAPIDLATGRPYKPSTHLGTGRIASGGHAARRWRRSVFEGRLCRSVAPRSRVPEHFPAGSSVPGPVVPRHGQRMENYREADLSAEQARAQAPARLPRPDGNRWRPQRRRASPRQGSQAPVGVNAPPRRMLPAGGSSGLRLATECGRPDAADGHRDTQAALRVSPNSRRSALVDASLRDRDARAWRER